MSIDPEEVEVKVEESCRSKSSRRSRWDDDDNDGEAFPWPLAAVEPSGGASAALLRGSEREESSLCSIFLLKETEGCKERKSKKNKSMLDEPTIDVRKGKKN